MQKGGSGKVDRNRLQRECQGKEPIAAIGIEALIALRKANIKPACVYGAQEAAIEAANKGLFPLIVCVDEEIPTLIKRLGETATSYQLLDLRLS